MSIIRSQTHAGFTSTLVVLVLLLFAAQLLASQPMAVGGEEQGVGSACGFVHAPPADDERAHEKTASSDGLENTQELPQCEPAAGGDLCSVNCSLTYAGKSATTDCRSMAAMHNVSSFSHIGRMISGPEPFPPKPAPIS